MSCGLLVSHCCDRDFLILASLQSSQPCDEILGRVAASIIAGDGLQGWDMRAMKWILLMAKHCIKWDMGVVVKDESERERDNWEFDRWKDKDQ